jgi:tRNA-splicing ligase RtcB (3'-phosphate/5'-hydroxy nucleic acid ligase)
MKCLNKLFVSPFYKPSQGVEIMAEKNYKVIDSGNGVPIKAWVNGVQLEDDAKKQLLNIASMPFIYRWVAVMPDVHLGKGATIGSVIPSRKAIIPAAVGVDLGCGVMAVQTDLNASDLPDNLFGIRAAIEKAVPHGRTDNGGRNDRGAWADLPAPHAEAWKQLKSSFERIVAKHPKIDRSNSSKHLGTLGTGNHFIEICLDEENRVWFMLHSGSRGVGNRIGSYFIELAKEDMRKWMINLPDKDLAYLAEGTEHFDDYVEAVHWAQEYAFVNRRLMMESVIKAMRGSKGVRPFEAEVQVINCHHNYVAIENHYGEDVFVTRKGAVRAQVGDMGIIPGSMGAQSFIVRGLGNPESFNSCSHGAGRAMSRNEARRTISLEEHLAATQGVECRKDVDVIDESPKSYKDILAVMKAQDDLVEVVHTLKQVVCVKG